MDLTQLLEPNQLTLSLILIIMSFIGFYGFLAVKLRNSLIYFSWMLLIIIFILTIIIDLSFIWFWLMILIGVFVILIISMYNDFAKPLKGN